MHYSRLTEILSQCRRKKLLVVGDVMLDRYVAGRVERICPEAPVQVVKIEGESATLGGCGNVARNLTPFGVQVHVGSVVGDDEDGRNVRQLLEENRIRAHGLFVDPSRPTTVKTRVTAERQQMIRLDRESTAPLAGEVEARLVAWLRKCVPSADLVLMSDYNKGVLTDSVRHAAIKAARDAGVPLIVDPKVADLRAYAGASLLKPNAREAEASWGRPIRTVAELERAGRSLRRTSACEALVITRGPQPTAVFQANRKVEYVPTLAREVFDLSGAGDTMLALLGIGLAGGASCIEAVELANIASGIVVGKVGTARAEEAEIIAQVADDGDAASRKAVDAQRLTAILGEARAKGRRIVFTNGCFDLLHAGHIRFLQEARRLGDLLVVGLNNDASVRRVKGYPRPFLKQDERVHILTALDCVDYVVVFNESTPRRLLQQLRPDVLVKGREQSVEAVVGREIVESRGGEVRVIETQEGAGVTELSREIHDLLEKK
jgi:D-beta-D-heptose 7-phosphate kinase/D-beta-D-heptose 1-phosphate adenosyltransferase